jgi:hypothetical protein
MERSERWSIVPAITIDGFISFTMGQGFVASEILSRLARPTAVEPWHTTALRGQSAASQSAAEKQKLDHHSRSLPVATPQDDMSEVWLLLRAVQESNRPYYSMLVGNQQLRYLQSTFHSSSMTANSEYSGMLNPLHMWSSAFQGVLTPSRTHTQLYAVFGAVFFQLQSTPISIAFNTFGCQNPA